jgi:hypothetical protein
MPKRKERQVKLHALKKEARYLIALLDNHWLLFDSKTYEGNCSRLNESCTNIKECRKRERRELRGSQIDLYYENPNFLLLIAICVT